jgi:hypothetical protein
MTRNVLPAAAALLWLAGARPAAATLPEPPVEATAVDPEEAQRQEDLYEEGTDALDEALEQ